MNELCWALDLGVNDYMIRPVDPQELTARLRTQIRRKRYHDALRKSVSQSIEMAVTDGLTGLHNRRYLDTHMKTLFERARQRNRPLSFLITDIDRFKSINDTLGHDGGDEVLREFALRFAPPGCAVRIWFAGMGAKSLLSPCRIQTPEVAAR